MLNRHNFEQHEVVLEQASLSISFALDFKQSLCQQAGEQKVMCWEKGYGLLHLSGQHLALSRSSYTAFEKTAGFSLLWLQNCTRGRKSCKVALWSIGVSGLSM